MFTKNLVKQAKDKKTGNIKLHHKMFEKMKEQGVKIYAYTSSKLTMTYTHECISNILSAAGVKAS
jgi:predicted peroxiredoxin